METENLSLSDFWIGVAARVRQNSEPAHKAACLHLLAVRPDIAKILTADCDPYHSVSCESPAYKRFEKFVVDHWEPTEENTAPKLSLHKFYFDGITRARMKGERYCQAMFNHLCEVRPDLSEKVRASDMDPFYCATPNDPKFDRFIAYIEKNW